MTRRTSRRRASRRRTSVRRNSDTRSSASVLAALQKLRVKSGGRATEVELAPGWRMTFSENHGDKDHPYMLRLHVRNTRGGVSERTVPLRRDQVESKGKSMWARDKSWSVKPDVLEGFATSIAASMVKTAEGERARAESKAVEPNR